ncbi:hypothetical protein BMR86_25880, partial [Stenotrophomonas sp. KAs 5-3]
MSRRRPKGCQAQPRTTLAFFKWAFENGQAQANDHRTTNFMLDVQKKTERMPSATQDYPGVLQVGL